MGIFQLAGNLNPAMEDITMDQIEGSPVGVDATNWVYKRGKNEHDRIGFFRRMVPLFERYQIKPIFVLDGKVPKLKKGVDDAKRPSDRPLITYLKSKNVEFIVAPYESDAQLAYLQREKYIEYIFTDDSDLIVYNCDNIIFKWNGQAGRLYKRDKLLHCHEKCDLSNFNFNQFVDVCMMVGCDYVSNLPDVGWVTACKLMQQLQSLEAIEESLFGNFESFDCESTEHWVKIYESRMMFKHMPVYDVYNRKIIYLESYVGCVVDLAFLGFNMDEKILWDIIHGYRNPNKNEMYKYKDDNNPYKIGGPCYYFSEGHQYYQVKNRLVVLALPSEPFTLQIDTQIYPPSKTSSKQLDKRFCTQCLAQGLRKNTFYEEIMAKKYKCRIEADKSLYPNLSSNGTIIDQGESTGNRHFAFWKDVCSLKEGRVECNHRRRRDFVPEQVSIRQTR